MRSQTGICLAIFLTVNSAVCTESKCAADVVKLSRLLKELDNSVSELPEKFTSEGTTQTARLALQIDEEVAQLAIMQEDSSHEATLKQVDLLARVQRRVDRLAEKTVAKRTQFAALAPGGSRRKALRAFIATNASLLDLSGRLRFTLYDAFDEASMMLSDRTDSLHSLIDLFVRHGNGTGAAVMSEYLKDPPKDNPDGLTPIDTITKAKILVLIAKTGQVDLLDRVVPLCDPRSTNPRIVVFAAHAIRQLGLPQDPLPGEDEGSPTPEITARQLEAKLSRVPEERLSPKQNRIRRELLAWLDVRVKKGITGPACRFGRYYIRPGDWLLMRNPSPYNLFTDLSPGLFTHVGVAAEKITSDGKRHIVIVDMPERGTNLPAVNVEIYLKRPLHFVFVRHDDAATARSMAKVASTIIGNPSQFDLNFRMDRVTSLKGQDLRGKKITTYCAGLLLLCSQETDRPRSEFYPFIETVAGGQMKKNLRAMGISIGENFVSPTGPLFSTKMQIAVRSEAFYLPYREVEQALFLHFAQQMKIQRLQMSLDQRQQLRLKIAAEAERNPLLARALAKANQVDSEMDLVAAAKAAAVIETLDEIAYGASGEYRSAWDAITEPISDAAPPARRREIVALRKRHPSLFDRYQNDQLSNRQLRISLVRYYVDRGQRQLDDRFFSDSTIEGDTLSPKN